MSDVDGDLPRGQRPPTTKLADRAAQASQPRFQLGLSDLLVAVLGVGVALGLIGRVPPARFSDEYIVLGFVLIPWAMWLAVKMLEQVAALSRGHFGTRATPAAARRVVVGPIIWRLCAAGFFTSFLAAEIDVLLSEPVLPQYGPRVVGTRASLLPLTGLLVMTGLVIGTRPASGPDRLRHPGLNRGARCLGWVALIAVCLASASYAAQIAYWLLLGIESLGLYGRYWDGSPRGVLLRLPAAAPASLLATATWLGGAVWIAAELRHLANSSAEPARGFRRWRFVITCLVMFAMAATASRLLFVTIPMLSLELADGLRQSIGPCELAIVATGIAGFSAGVAAVVAGRRSTDPADVTAASAQDPVSRRGSRLRAGPSLVVAGLGNLVTDELRVLFSPLLWQIREAEHWTFVGAYTEINLLMLAPWLLWVVIETVATFATTRPAHAESAFDRALSRPATVWRFVWSWATLSVVVVAALPTLLVAGLALYDFWIQAVRL